MSQELEENENLTIKNGFPNPARSQTELNLNHLLLKRPNSSFIFRISGHNYSDQGIYDNDLVVIDRSLSALSSDLLLVWQDGGFKLVRKPFLEAEEYWGVLVNVIHSFR